MINLICSNYLSGDAEGFRCQCHIPAIIVKTINHKITLIILSRVLFLQRCDYKKYSSFKYFATQYRFLEEVISDKKC